MLAEVVFLLTRLSLERLASPVTALCASVTPSITETVSINSPNPLPVPGIVDGTIGGAVAIAIIIAIAWFMVSRTRNRPRQVLEYSEHPL